MMNRYSESDDVSTLFFFLRLLYRWKILILPEVKSSHDAIVTPRLA